MLIEDNVKTDPESDDDEVARAEFPISRVIGLSVVSSYYDDDSSDKISIESYSLTSYEKRTLKIQINFLHPNFLSMDTNSKDKLRIFFIQPWFFMDEEDKVTL